MRSTAKRALRAGQRGRVGPIMALVALVLVAALGRETMKQLGVSPQKTAATKAGTPGERARAPGAVGAEALDLDSPEPAPRNAIEKARSVQATVNRQSEALAARIESETR